jgi:hypothetical protein
MPSQSFFPFRLYLSAAGAASGIQRVQWRSKVTATIAALGVAEYNINWVSDWFNAVGEHSSSFRYFRPSERNHRPNAPAPETAN